MGDLRRYATKSPTKAVDAALALLGMTALPADAEGVRAGFVACMKRLGGAQGIAEGDYDMDAMTKAKELLIAAVSADVNQPLEITCIMCGGSGRIAASGFGRPCPSCNGTGHK